MQAAWSRQHWPARPCHSGSLLLIAEFAHDPLEHFDRLLIAELPVALGHPHERIGRDGAIRLRVRVDDRLILTQRFLQIAGHGLGSNRRLQLDVLRPLLGSRPAVISKPATSTLVSTLRMSLTSTHGTLRVACAVMSPQS